MDAQQQLNRIAAEAKQTSEHFIAGLLTIEEYFRQIAFTEACLKDIDLVGLIDPISGLRLTTDRIGSI